MNTQLITQLTLQTNETITDRRNMKTDIKSLLEFAGVDTTKGKAKLLVEATSETSEQFHKKWSDEDLKLLLNHVARTDFSKEEMNQMASEFAERYADRLGRTKAGISQILMQLHMVVYGKFPDGVIVYPGQWQSVSRRMVAFAVQNGYEEAAQNIESAKVDMAERIERKKTRSNAPYDMYEYYKANKARLPKDIVKHKDEIIASMQNGLSAEEAFGRFV